MPSTVSGTIYFDNAATTAPLPGVVEKLQELTLKVTGNSSSAHRKGRQAQEALDSFQESLGRQFDVPPSHVLFTSGGTESNNLAVWGVLGGLVQAFKWLRSGSQAKLLTSKIEHSSLGKTFEALGELGARVGWIGVDSEGLLRLDELERELGEGRTKLVSLHHAQSEIGILQDVATVSRLVRSKQPDAILHIDAVQSFLRAPVRLNELGADIISLSAHKLGGPKGIGALILGRRFEGRNPKLGALFQGASHQYGIRPGTVPVPLIGAFIEATKWGETHFTENREKLLRLRQRLISTLPRQAVLNGPADTSDSNPRRAPQTVNFSVPGIPSAVLVDALSMRGFCVSAGSACHSTNPRPNETLMNMGAGRDRALSALRVSFSPFNTLAEVDTFTQTLPDVISEIAL